MLLSPIVVFNYFVFSVSGNVRWNRFAFFMTNDSSTIRSELLHENRTPLTDIFAILASQPALLSLNVVPRKKLLWVDDCEDMLSLYKARFESWGYEIWATSSPHDALDAKCLSVIDLAILDYEMPDLDGGELALMIKNRHPQMPIILYSGSLCIAPTVNDCVDAICPKGGPQDELLSTIQRLTSGPVSYGLTGAQT